MDILATPVCVARNDGYDESMGAFTEFYFWDGEQVTVKGGIYSNLAYNAYSIDADIDQIEAAGIWLQENTENRFNGNFIGCTVILKRSRKAPNGVSLEVVDQICNHWGKEEIAVLVDDCKVWVSSNCVEHIAELPPVKRIWWASESRIDELREAEKAALEQTQKEKQAQKDKQGKYVSLLASSIKSGASDKDVKSVASILAKELQMDVVEILKLAGYAESPVNGSQSDSTKEVCLHVEPSKSSDSDTQEFLPTTTTNRVHKDVPTRLIPKHYQSVTSDRTRDTRGYHIDCVGGLSGSSSSRSRGNCVSGEQS